MENIGLHEILMQKYNPYPLYRQLSETSPLTNLIWRGHRVWIVTRYADVKAILKDPRFTLDREKVALAANEPGPNDESPCPPLPLDWNRHLLTLEPPDHTRLRVLVSQAFTPRAIERQRTRVQQITDELIDAVHSRGQMDLIEEFAFPLPFTIISEILGIPSKDRQNVRNWTQRIWRGAFPAFADIRVAEKAFYNYITALIAEKLADPGDDLVSSLVEAANTTDTLNENELISLIFLLITSGYETTSTLIGNGLLALLEHPEQMHLLQADPTLLPSAIEELLRYVAPISFLTQRWAREDVSMHGQLIRKGEIVKGILIAANTDSRQFADSETLNILRRENPHLAFGKGIHHCLGAPLARLEGQIAIGTLLCRLPHIRLAVDPTQLIWRDQGSLRSLAALPVTF
ncbi:cytochrome P450 [Ktedonosporobacter rubrisoli]|uniref:Cytochrome P450 n=1 Tax=Ktedonosporobacter rubrisoli TaxID=2509675 RepID=A0A4P6JPW5_KTERU|nr:cytochrome P450 [Ktedonosporobacter rubrisoli]QBD77200.1 cytochrome P450 [Ktedonosporobacter rubrisoli]